MDLITNQCQGPFASISRAQTMGEHGPSHPQPLSTSHSFSRLEPTPPTPLGQSVVSTLRNETTPGSIGPVMDAFQRAGNSNTKSSDIFDKGSGSSSTAASTSATGSVSPKMIPEEFDELPIELISLTDRYEPLYCLR